MTIIFCHRSGRRDLTNSNGHGGPPAEEDPLTSIETSTTVEVTPISDDIKLGIVSYNCKNIITSKHAISEIARDIDVIFIQEHWLLNYQLHILDEISESLLGRGKAVDDNDPISPVQKPCGYGGVGILWSKRIDHLFTPIPDGSTRIQCAILKRSSINLLLISVYMPCKASKIISSIFVNVWISLPKLSRNIWTTTYLLEETSMRISVLHNAHDA